MEFPSSSFLLKLVLLSLLAITANAIPKPTKRPYKNKLIPLICPKTKNPKACFTILRLNNRTRSATTLHGLGEYSLEGAISQAKSSAEVFNNSLKDKDVSVPDKKKFKDCGDNYEMARKKLVESKIAWNKKDYSLARKSLEVACHVPSSCEKELAGADRFRRVNMMTDFTFDIPFVIVKELTGERST